MLCVVAFITPKKEFYETAKQAIVDILAETRAEPGCNVFLLHENSDQDQLCLYEQFASQEALDEHYQKPYVIPVFKAYENWLAKPVEIKKLTLVA